jgi:membrane-associated phospholipid phosphatase
VPAGISPAAAQVRRLLLLALIAVLVLAAVYLIAVRTELGQRADEAAFTGRVRAPDEARTAAHDLLRVVSVASLIAGLVALGTLAWIRGQTRVLLIPVVVIGVSLLGTELLKHELLTRPDYVLSPIIPDNSYPSGHTTIAVSVGLSAMLIAPPRLRSMAAIGGALLAAGVGVLVVTAGWHRPSDAIGAYAWTLAVASATLAAVFAISPLTLERERHAHRELPSGRRTATRIEIGGVLLGAALFTSTVAIATLRYGQDIDWTKLDAAFLGSSAAIVIAAAATFAALIRVLATGAGALEPEPAVGSDTVTRPGVTTIEERRT